MRSPRRDARGRDGSRESPAAGRRGRPLGRPFIRPERTGSSRHRSYTHTTSFQGFRTAMMTATRRGLVRSATRACGLGHDSQIMSTGCGRRNERSRGVRSSRGENSRQARLPLLRGCALPLTALRTTAASRRPWDGAAKRRRARRRERSARCRRQRTSRALVRSLRAMREGGLAISANPRSTRSTAWSRDLGDGLDRLKPLCKEMHKVVHGAALA